MNRAWLSAVLAGLALAAAPSLASAHSAFLGSTPEPGAKLAASPREVRLTFTEKLNGRLTTASLVRADGAKPSGVTSAVSSTRLLLRIAAPLAKGSYRVSWHTVSTSDGHALEGSFSFGVRAAALGGEHDVQQSPFARDGWLRVVAHGLLYAALLTFAGALMLDALLGRRGRDWLVPPGVADQAPSIGVDAIVTRRRRLLIDVGFLAAGAAALSAIADAVDAAGGLSVRGVNDFLLSGAAGLTRVGVVVLVLLGLGGVVLRRRGAALPAAGALGCVALSGHANASSSRALAVVNDWVHLSSTALWVGGVAFLVLTWGPTTRRAGTSDRLVLAREVLPRFGRVALPAFVVVVLTGVISAVIELGRFSELWRSDYGRVLMIKVGVVGLIAAASYLHAMRIRPRLLSAAPSRSAQLERRHWRLLRTEPLLAIGVAGAVAVLVAFPLPPRQLTDADHADAASLPSCVECPLPRPAADELAVADSAGSDVVAAWLRRDGQGVSGAIRLYGLDHAPARDPMAIAGAASSSCGVGCLRFHVPAATRTLAVAVRQRGRTYTARLPTTWKQGADSDARRLLADAQQTMRELRSVRELERTSSVPGLYAVTRYSLKAPDRMTFRTNGGVESVVIGPRQWLREQSEGWHVGPYGGGLPFRTRSWFTWTTYARQTYLLGHRREGGRDIAVIAMMDQGTPAWWRLYIDVQTHRVLRDQLVTYGHFSTERFSAINAPLLINAPRGVGP